MESKYYYQLGMQKRWELYSKSFLDFGFDSARLRHTQSIAELAISQLTPGSAEVPFYIDYCFFAGYSELVISTMYPNISVRMTGPPVPAQDQFDRCVSKLSQLLFDYDNSSASYCDDVYYGQCSLNGAFQPNVTSPMPTDSDEGNHLPFVGTSLFAIPWHILLLPQSASLIDYKTEAERICAMTFLESIQYELNAMFIDNPILAHQVPNYCFLVSYLYVLLVDGYNFPQDQVFTVSPSFRNDMSTNWAWGAILYEINNTSPPPSYSMYEHQLFIVCIAIILMIICCVAGHCLYSKYKYCSSLGQQSVSNGESFIVEDVNRRTMYQNDYNAHAHAHTHTYVVDLQTSSHLQERDADRTQRWDIAGSLPFSTRHYQYESISDSQETLVS